MAKQICGITSFKGKLAFYHKQLGKETGESVRRTRMGKGIAEEAPSVYKDVDEVVNISNQAGIGKLYAK